ncbi:hypothetical protein IEQ34_025929 [Dendrobium chrysotoxum]|uniref:NADH-ubiquinone oxidoreductase chain 6 n=1 Tax=Dendrobium chrysotoxum TaxID=161865 RepID=A0AAV7FNQ1_DENCH|nr:hypothetical protein IEQ34_025929 [Dendrobium chrysotoxum]
MILSVSSSPALVSGLMVVRAKNPVHSVSFPIPVFRDTAGLLLFLGLDFSAMISPVVHIGAIAVSFLFVVMMFNIQIAEIHEEVLRYLPVSGIIGLIFWWEMFFICDNETIPLLPTPQKDDLSEIYGSCRKGGNHEERQALNCLNVFPVDVLAVKNLYLPVIAPIARIWFPERTVWVTSSSDPVLGLETTGYVAKEMGGISNSIDIDTKFLSLR